MAVTWNWDSKMGEATFRRQIGDDKYRDINVNLYEGNAFLIFIYEYEEDGRNMYNLQGFFADKAHMKRCLGIDKKDKESYGNNIYNKPYDRLTKIRLNKAKSRNYKDIVAAMSEAFDDIDIEIYAEKEVA